LTNEKCVQEVVKAIVIIIPKAFYLTFKDSILYWHNNILPVLQLACLFNYFIGAIPVLDFGHSCSWPFNYYYYVVTCLVIVSVRLSCWKYSSCRSVANNYFL